MASAEDVDDLDDLLDDALDDFQQLKVKASEAVAEKGQAAKKKFDPLGKASRTAGKKTKAKKFDPLGLSGSNGSGTQRRAPAASETDNLMDQLAEQFAGGLEDDGELQSMVDGVMRQLLSKEVLYEPLREISSKYPEWLEKNGSKISKEDHARYSLQLECIQRLCAVYESSNALSGFDDVLHLMQEIQSCGQPPEDIIKELAPDLQLGPDGAPVAGESQDALQLFGDLTKNESGGCPMQ